MGLFVSDYARGVHAETPLQHVLHRQGRVGRNWRQVRDLPHDGLQPRPAANAQLGSATCEATTYQPNRLALPYSDPVARMRAEYPS